MKGFRTHAQKKAHQQAMLNHWLPRPVSRKVRRKRRVEDERGMLAYNSLAAQELRHHPKEKPAPKPREWIHTVRVVPRVIEKAWSRIRRKAVELTKRATGRKLEAAL